MFIVDSQVHIWKEETPDRPWVPGARERMKLNGHRTEAFTYLKSVTTGGVPKLTIPSPSMLNYRGGTSVIDKDVYPDLDQFYNANWSDDVFGPIFLSEERMRELGYQQ